MILLFRVALADVTQAFAAGGWSELVWSGLVWSGALPERLAHSTGTLVLAGGQELGKDRRGEPLYPLCVGLLVGLLELPPGMAAGVQAASPKLEGPSGPGAALSALLCVFFQIYLNLWVYASSRDLSFNFSLGFPYTVCACSFRFARNISPGDLTWRNT